MAVIARCVVVDTRCEGMETVALTPEAGQMLWNAPEKFRAPYGDDIVHGMTSGSELTMVFNCTKTSENKPRQFKTSVSASDADLFSASGYLDFTSTAKTHDVSTSMTVFFGALKSGTLPPTDGTPADYLKVF